MIPDEVGATIRSLRLSRGLPLRVVAQEVGVSESFVSQVERGVANPSIASLQRIAVALGVSLPDFFTGDLSPTQVVREAEARRLRRPRRDAEEIFLTPRGVKNFALMVSVLHPGQGSGEELYAHTGDEECVYVLTGEVVIRTEEKEYELSSGDVLALEPRRPHGYKNQGQNEAKLLWITAPPGVDPV
ncbi:helix-turn-helix domain-containing protein [Nesterenkonia lutea]|uniref:Transcriptional regulator with XRE-family HTH domain n=1 Tax=Nesterenkonia lutea TaxID=272919 RepID=A0ABR9JHT2_9MICC|nr:cupin domain-containing protein [Nesterenkonia lutea]MBE1525481.1 transcriptional regulator with XRE-family HTH domain [Nesterenkonia lutea]